MSNHERAAQSMLETMDALAKGILAGLNDVPPEMRAHATAWRLEWFAARWLKIRTKAGGPLAPFAFNWVQKDFLVKLRRKYRPRGTKGLDRFRGIRANVLKPRQLGFSTFIAALFFCDGLMNPGRVTVVCTHLQKMSEELLRTYRIFWDFLPDDVKQGLTLKSGSKYEFSIEFPPGPNGEINPESRFLIWTEKGEDFRGGKIDNLHGSEVAFYRDYLKWKTAFFQAVGPDGNIVLETTANGMNAYHDDVQAAHRGESSFWLVFYGWHQHAEYKRPWNPEVEDPPSEWEQEQMALHGWTLEQLAWRRWKVAEIGSEERFRQEFPATVDEAFLTTGRPFFPMVKVKAVLDRLNAKPIPCLEPRANVRVFEAYQEGHTYILSADVAEGIDAGGEVPGNPERGGSDFCSAYVLDTSTLRVAATIHGRIPPVEFARICDWLGRQYRACIAPERNNHGHTVVHVLESAFYPWIYRHLEYDASGTEKHLRAGFPTDTKTRPQILDALWQAINTGLLHCPDIGLWRECTTFHRSANGKPEAMEGYHDDRVMALAIGVYLATLGRTAWGAPDGTWSSDATGLPLSASEPPIPSLPPVVMPPEPPGPEAGVLAHIAAAPKPGSCGSCMNYQDGACHSEVATGGRKVLVSAEDPGCWALLVRQGAPAGALWGEADGTVGA